MEDSTLKDDFYVTYIGGVDVVLVIQWLYSQGTYSTNHWNTFLSFHQDVYMDMMHEAMGQSLAHCMVLNVSLVSYV